MKQLNWLSLVLAVCLSASAMAQQPSEQGPPPRADLQINWQGIVGATARYSIPPGATIVWVMRDARPHTVTHRSASGAPLFDSGILKGKGQWFAHRFDQPGQYEVFDKEHPSTAAVIDVR